jgi:hypothetical protein
MGPTSAESLPHSPPPGSAPGPRTPSCYPSSVTESLSMIRPRVVPQACARTMHRRRHVAGSRPGARQEVGEASSPGSSLVADEAAAFRASSDRNTLSIRCPSPGGCIHYPHETGGNWPIVRAFYGAGEEAALNWGVYRSRRRNKPAAGPARSTVLSDLAKRCVLNRTKPVGQAPRPLHAEGEAYRVSPISPAAADTARTRIAGRPEPRTER